MLSRTISTCSDSDRDPRSTTPTYRQCHHGGCSASDRRHLTSRESEKFQLNESQNHLKTSLNDATKSIIQVCHTTVNSGDIPNHILYLLRSISLQTVSPMGRYYSYTYIAGIPGPHFDLGTMPVTDLFQIRISCLLQ